MQRCPSIVVFSVDVKAFHPIFLKNSPYSIYIIIAAATCNVVSPALSGAKASAPLFKKHPMSSALPSHAAEINSSLNLI